MRLILMSLAVMALTARGACAESFTMAGVTSPGDGDPLGTQNGVAQMRPMTATQLGCASVKVAAVQLDAAPGDNPVDKVLAYIKRAADDEAQLVVFPEYYLGKMKASDPPVTEIRKTAKACSIYVVVGLFEILDEAGRFGNCALLINRQGEIQGRYFKVHPAIGEPPHFWPPKPDDVEWQMEKGDAFPVFDLDFGRVGILTCYDGYFPETFRILALKGAEILVWINSRNGSIEDYLVKAAMSQNYVHLIGCNRAVGAGTMIAQWPTSILQVTNEPGERYLCGDLDMKTLRTVRKEGGREFHQRRPDLYGELLKCYPVWEQYGGQTSSSPAQQGSVTPSKGAKAQIELTPVAVTLRKRSEAGLRNGENLFRLATRISAPWMQGYVELRFPEYLRSSLGFHLLDHFSDDITPSHELDPLPQWERDASTQAIHYRQSMPEGLEFSATATPADDCVDIEFTVINRSDKPIASVEQNCCLDLGGSPDFNHRGDLSNLFAVFDGNYQTLANTTPTPAQMKRAPWIIMLTPTSVKTFKGPKDTPTWWRVDQVAEENLMAAQSADGTHVIAYAWDREGETLMSNCGNPCLHCGPGAVAELKPGELHSWRGRIYLMANQPEVLLARYRADRAAWAAGNSASPTAVR